MRTRSCVITALFPCALIAAQASFPSPAAAGENASAPRVLLNQDAGLPTQVAIDWSQQDGVPLPDPARVRAGEQGDVVLAPASGDPFFLGFATGRIYPPRGERIDPDLLRSIDPTSLEQRAEAATYAFVMLGRRITTERIAALESCGAQVLGFHPHYILVVKLPPEAIVPVSSLPFVRWVGAAKPWQKIHPNLAADQAVMEVYIDVFESDLCAASELQDAPPASEIEPGAPVVSRATTRAKPSMSHGWQELALVRAGAEILDYSEEARAFRARITPEVLAALVQLDFVQFIEPVVSFALHHDESTPMILSDYVRQYASGGTNRAAVVGEIDSGEDGAHTALQFAAVGWDFTGDGGPYVDRCEHGSHVMGTILGRGTVRPSFAGNAPGLGFGDTGRVFIAKIFGDACDFSGDSLSTIFSVIRSPYTDAQRHVTPAPHAINNSWGSDPGSSPWIGTEANARTLDNEVYDYNQLYVFAAGNAGPAGSTIGLPAVAKNAFTVGSVADFQQSPTDDPGALSYFSSRGPTGDGRWKPNLVAPGDAITSVDANSGTGYRTLQGTSMAAPHVTGVAAQMLDTYSFLRYAPHRLASILMATALTRNDQPLTSPSTNPNDHLNMYGSGRVEAMRAMFSTSQMTWTNWGFTQTGSGYNYGDFTVNAGATRLVVCMTYHEAAASAGASKALVNDIDLYIDGPPVDTGHGNTGEYVAQQSPRDNTEIRILDNPLAGTWRWKAWPTNVPKSAKVSVTVALVYGDTTPSGTLTLSASKIYVKPSESFDLMATVTNPSFIASAVFLDSTQPSVTTLTGATTTLKDGAVTDLLHNEAFGYDVLLGDIVHGDSRSVRWTAKLFLEGTSTWSVSARSDNWIDKSTSMSFVVDGTAPGLPSSLGSSTHQPNVWSNKANITYTWNPAVDSNSGVDGYGILTSQGTPKPPEDVKDLGPVTSFAETLGSSAIGYYFDIKTVDRCGNWSISYANAGPFLIDTVAPSNGTLKIAGGAATTTTLLVSLDSLGAQDTHSGVAQMQFSNDGGITWSPPEAYAPARTGWDLSAHGGNTLPGSKSVTARYLDRAGNVGAVVSDTIEYAPRPDAKTIAPDSGPSDGGNTVTIRGSDFTPSSTVRFGAQAAAIVTYVSASELSVVVPALGDAQSPTGSRRGIRTIVPVVVSTQYASDSTPLAYTYVSDS